MTKMNDEEKITGVRFLICIIIAALLVIGLIGGCSSEGPASSVSIYDPNGVCIKRYEIQIGHPMDFSIKETGFEMTANSKTKSLTEGLVDNLTVIFGLYKEDKRR